MSSQWLPRPAKNKLSVKRMWYLGSVLQVIGRDPFNQHSDRSDREKRTTSKGGPVFSKLFRLDRTDPLSFGPKFPEILVEWIAPISSCAGTYVALIWLVTSQCDVVIGTWNSAYEKGTSQQLLSSIEIMNNVFFSVRFSLLFNSCHAGVKENS